MFLQQIEEQFKKWLTYSSKELEDKKKELDEKYTDTVRALDTDKQNYKGEIKEKFEQEKAQLAESVNKKLQDADEQHSRLMSDIRKEKDDQMKTLQAERQKLISTIDTKLADADKKLAKAGTIRDEIAEESQQINNRISEQEAAFTNQTQQQKEIFNQQVKELKSAGMEAVRNAESSSRKFAADLQVENDEYRKELNQTIKQIRKASKGTSPVPTILSSLALLISIATAVLLLTGILPLKKSEASPTPIPTLVTAEPQKVTITEEPTEAPTETPTETPSAEPTDEPTNTPNVQPIEGSDEQPNGFVPNSALADYASGKGTVLESVPDEFADYTDWINYPSDDKLLVQTDYGYVLLSKVELSPKEAFFRADADNNLYRIDKEKGIYTVTDPDTPEEVIYIYLITKSADETDKIASGWNLLAKNGDNQ